MSAFASVLLSDGLHRYEMWDTFYVDSGAGERFDRNSLVVRWRLEKIAERSFDWDTLRSFVHRFQSGFDPIPDPQIVDTLVDWIEWGRVALAQLPSELPAEPLGSRGDRLPPNVHEEPDPIEPLTHRWIEVRVHDLDGAPLAGLRYRLVGPQGETAEGELAEDGLVRLDDIGSSGTCDFELLGLGDHPRPRDKGPRPAADVTTTITYRHEGMLRLSTNRMHCVLVQPPPPQPAASFRGAMFGRGSAFPTAAIAPLLRHAQEWADEPDNRERSLGVFAHADRSGDEQRNKELSDRRADAVFAMLTGQLQPLRDVAERDGWGVAEVQAMLRALGCNPGAIDGIEGPMTMEAVRVFRREYNADVFHQDVRAREHGELEEGDALDADTRDALLDAYHAEYSVGVPPERFWGPGRMGCGEFNPFTDKASIVKDRRVTLVQYGADRPRPADFPCTRDDAGACTIDDDGTRRCKFYRDNVADDALDEPFPFWDFDWLQTPKGGAHLSSMTTLPDGDQLEFIVELLHQPATPEDSDYGPPPAPRGVELARVDGMVRKGVAYALWSPPEHYDPFDASRWFEYVPEETERRLILPAFQPPVFAIDGDTDGGPVWGLAGPPGKERRHLSFLQDLSGPATVVRNDGVFLRVDDLADARNASDGHRIVAIFRPNTRFDPDPSVESPLKT
ncbi:MAG: OmpA family protein [Nannocystaceae bacterium]